MIIFILIIVILLFILFKCKIKKLQYDSILEINGAVGSGKSSTSLHICLKELKRKRFKFYIKKYLFRKKNLEYPLIYSNVPLFNIDYVHIDNNDIINRSEWRFNYDSVLYLNEASLMANSQNYKDQDLNDSLTMFVKLIRHEMHGSGVCMCLDTQSPNDLHYSCDRSINKMLYITRHINWIPFIRVVWVRELAMNIKNTENQVASDFTDDNNDRMLFIPKSIFKKYDSYCYSVLTDDLPAYNNTTFIKRKKYKKRRFHIPTYTRYKEISENNKIVLEMNEKEGVNNDK